jgi:hypothetical protein
MNLKPSDLIEIKSPGVWVLNGRSLTSKEVEHFKAQAEAFLNSSLYKFITAALERHALKIGFSEAKTFEDTNAGKAMIVVRDVMNTVLWEMSNDKPIGMK